MVRRKKAVVAGMIASIWFSNSWAAPQPPAPPPALEFANPAGVSQTFSTAGAINPNAPNNPFFQSLGTNGRTCATCHEVADGWTVTPPNIQARFNQSNGLDPIFSTNDGSNSPLAKVATLADRQSAYSMLLRKGLFRIGLGIPAAAEFELTAVDDPYNFASAAELSLFRRPRPSANLTFLSSVMWDGREDINASIVDDLGLQANTATLQHAQASKNLTALQIQEIVNFETSLYIAQIEDNVAGMLNTNGAQGGAAPLSTQTYYPGINDPKGNNPTKAAFSPAIFNLYNAWSSGTSKFPPAQQAAMASILRGQILFNTKTFVVTKVNGINDPPNPTSVTLTCGSCHDAPNVGGISVPAFQNTGVAGAARRTPDMPLYTLKNISTGETIQVTDPGRALVTGLWADIGKFKTPTLRGLAARAPFFHDGSAPTLADVVRFYNNRFAIGLTTDQQVDLTNFLQGL